LIHLVKIFISHVAVSMWKLIFVSLPLKFSCCSTATLYTPYFHTLFITVKCPFMLDYKFWLRINYHWVCRLYYMFQCK
jgi:hypothetical protein